MEIIISKTQEKALNRAVAQSNASQADPALHLTAAQFFAMASQGLLEGYVNQFCPVQISQTEFLRRIPAQKRIAIRAAAKTSPELADYMALLDATLTVNLADPDTIGGIKALVAAGILTQDEADVILDN